MREWLYERKRQETGLTAPQLVEALRQEFGVSLSDAHVNYLLRKVGLTRAPGRPYKVPEGAGDEEAEPLGSGDETTHGFGPELDWCSIQNS